MTSEGIVVGIDLGTTYSAISFYNEITKKPELIRDKSERENIASWISMENFHDSGNFKANDRIIIGNAAKDTGLGDYVIYDAKRLIGKDYKTVYENDKKALDNWPFEVENYEGPCIVFKDKNEKTDRMYPEEVSGLILRYLVNCAKAKTNAEKCFNF